VLNQSAIAIQKLRPCIIRTNRQTVRSRGHFVQSTNQSFNGGQCQHEAYSPAVLCECAISTSFASPFII
jgi:hypothetical protein